MSRLSGGARIHVIEPKRLDRVSESVQGVARVQANSASINAQ